MTMPGEFAALVARHAVSVLSTRPAVVAAYESDFEKNESAFAAFARGNGNVAILLQIGFEHETPEPSARLGAAISRFREAVPSARVIVLCNSEAEVNAIGAHGAETRFLHQNCFLDERRFRPMRGTRTFDAAYLARLTPFKRHTLIPVELAPRLLLLGAAMHQVEREYADGIRKRFAAARVIGHFPGMKVSEYLAKAKCGLILSESEGASFASSEYLLCGLPVVDTPARGGRSALYPEEFVRYVESSPEAVGEGVAHWVANRPDPWKVRAAWLEKARPHREAYRELMRELTGRNCGRPPHKLGIRTPHPGAAHSLAIRMYLAMKGLVAG